MPAIFDDLSREATRVKLLENGFALIKKTGVKKTSVEEISASVGLAKGTFYSFFPSKEEFVYQIMVHKRIEVKAFYAGCADADGKIGRSEMRRFLHGIRGMDTNLYKYFSDADVAYLRARWPEEYFFSVQKDEETTRWMMGFFKDARPDVDWKLLANYMKSISVLHQNSDLFHEDAFESLLDIYMDAILNVAFREQDAPVA